MASDDRQIPILLGQPYCTLCGRGQYCRDFYDAEPSRHLKDQDQIHLDYHSKVVVIDANIDEGRGRTGYPRSKCSSRRLAYGPLEFPRWTESKTGKTFELRPYAPYFKKRFHSKAPPHYEIYLPDDLVYTCDYDKNQAEWPWNPKTNRWEPLYYKKGDPHRAAGGYIGRARVATLGTLSPGAHILFKNEKDEWQQGQVGNFESYKSVRRRIEQANRKRRQRYRTYMKRATFWDHIESAD